MTPVPWRTALRLCALAGRTGLLVGFGLVLVQALLPVLGLFAMQWLVDAVARGISGAEPVDQALAHATTAVAIAAGTALCGSIARSASAVVTETHGRQLADACAAEMQEHTARLDLAEFDRASFHD